MKFELPSLDYDYGALAPHIDATTMEIHHSKHHQAYMDKLNGYCAENEVDESIEQIVAGITGESPALVRNNAGGYHNHMLFWENLTPDQTEASSSLREAIEKSFESVDACMTEIAAQGAGRFGSGWVWLVSDAQGSVSVMSTPNQDSPLMSAIYGEGFVLLLAIDVWEHAYYLAYQNRRPDYLSAIQNVINWDVVSARYASVTA